VRQKERVALRLNDISDHTPWESQIPFHQSDAITRCYVGANFAGKTHSGAAEVAWWLTKTHPYKPWIRNKILPIRVFIICVNHDVQCRPGGPQDRLMSLIPHEDIANTDYEHGKRLKKFWLKNGSRCDFISARSGREVLQGARIHLIWGDEDCIPNAVYYSELQWRIPDEEVGNEGEKQAVHFIFSFTPNLKQNKESFIVENILPKANKPETSVRLWERTIFDNPTFNIEERDRLINDTEGDPEVLAGRIYGDWRVKSGLVYKFDKKVHVIPPIGINQLKKMRGVWRIIDPHPAKNIMVVFGCIDKHYNFIIWNELWDEGLVKQVANRMREVCSGLGYLIVKTIIDYSGNAKDKITGRSVTEEFRENGINCSNCKKDVLSGIDTIRKLLYSDNDDGEKPRLFVTSNCKRTIEEFGKYRWDQEAGKPFKKWDEAMDSIRYWVADDSVRQFIEVKNGNRNTKPIDIDNQLSRMQRKGNRKKKD